MTLQIEYDAADLARLHRALGKLDMQHLVKPMFSQIGTTVYEEVRVRPDWVDSPPPYPYWIRGKGWQYASGWNDQSSQNSYNRWYTKTGPDYLIVGNAATYASDVFGPDQMQVHAKHGWRKLYESAVKVLPEVIRKLEARAKALWDQTV